MIIAVAVVLLAALGIADADAQVKNEIVLSGKVVSAITGRPVEFGSVTVLEAKVRAFTQSDGTYRVSIPVPGEYTVVVRSDELRTLTVKMNISRNTVRDFHLQPLSVKGEGIIISAPRDIQKVSRYTMTVKELKEVPGSFGDSINALTSLPGVIRTGGIFGPLVIRGADLIRNRYLIDDIPIYNPLHFGGIHSVINNNLMSEIDLYSSAFPAQFGFANAAVININTVDDVKEFGGYTDLGLISASGLIQAPILRGPDGGIEFASPSYIPRQDDGYSNAGYIIASGRVGYLSLFIPLIYEIVTGDELPFVPEYWDYQVKMKYYFNSHHSMTLFLMGSSDYLTFNEDRAEVVNPDEGDDPLLEGFKAQADWSSHSQGLYYTWQPGELFWNKLMVYAALVRYYSYFTLTNDYAASWLKDINIDSRPYIFGAKESFRAEPLKNHLVVRGGIEYTFYRFTASGKTIMSRTRQVDFDVGNEDLFSIVKLDEKITNHTLGGYLQSKIMFWWIKLEPGVRADYLDRTKEVIVDPRGVASIEFPSETTLSFAMGRYSYFFQTNQYLFIQTPQVTKIGEDLKPERAIHRVIALEQRIGDYTARAEGFYNNFYDLAEEYYHYGSDGLPRDGLCSGKQKAYGFEIMLKKDLRENETGMYGWINYTYTRSKYKSGLPTEAGLYGDSRNLVGDPWGDTWIDFMYEMRHKFQMVGGWIFRVGNFKGKHSISWKFQYYSSFPYTPIVDSIKDPNYPGDRYVPIYGKTNTARFEDDHQLDIRYTYRRDYSWGYVSWYVEMINVYGQWYAVRNDYLWDYRKPYGSENPRFEKPEGLRWIPNFGVEVKF